MPDQNKEYHLTLVQPEHLFDKYKIGMTYQNDEEIDIIGTDYSVFGTEKPNLEGLKFKHLFIFKFHRCNQFIS